MSKPKLLDLFCGAGGCAMGYSRAGFEVVGVDHETQPNYPFEFIKADALMFLRCMMEDCPEDNGGMAISDFAVIHASPPCQVHSAAKRIGNGRPEHRDYLPQTLALLEKAGRPWVVENVPGAPLFPSLVLCRTQFGLPLRRHRLFASSHLLMLPANPCLHRDGDYTVFGHAVQRCGSKGKPYQDASGRTHWRQLRRPLKEGQEAMGIDWMNRAELSQAIPPVFTEFIGKQLRRVI